MSTRPTGTRRRVAVTAAALAAVLGLGSLGAWAIAGAPAEMRLAERIRPATPGVPEPLVTVSGDGFTARIEEVPRPGMGPVAVQVRLNGAAGVDGVEGAALGDGPVVHARELQAWVDLTGESLAPLLGTATAVLASGRDSSLAGATEDTAQLVGLDAGGREVTRGRVRIEVSGGRLRLVPTDADDADDAGRPSRGVLELPADLLPLGLPVERASIRAGVLTVGGHTSDVTVPLAALAEPAPPRA